MKKMYKGKVNSPQTQLIEDIGINTANIKVLDASVFPDGPNLAVIGNDVQAETIKYDSINNNILVGCVRGFQGKANAWKKDSVISRNFTEYDLNVIQENILELDNNKVDKVDGKDLSSNDFTNEEKNKLANIEGGANKYIHPSTHSANMITETTEKNFVSDTEKQNWNDKIDKSQIIDDAYGRESDKIVSQKGITFMRLDILRELQNKANSSQIPTNISQLTNDKNFKTEAEIQELINNSTKLKKEVVTSLPATGKEDVIYLLKNKNDTNNYYTEYMCISGKWEIIGDTKVDLTGYLKTTDLKSAKLRTNKNSINVFTDRSTSEHQLDIILGDLELRTEENKKNIKTKLSELIDDENHRVVTDTEIQSWNKKFELPEGKENQVLMKTTNGAEFKEISSSRSATFIIANYDSSENSKAGADYVIQENESPCDIINSFIEKLPNYGGKIQLTEGNFIEKNDKNINLNKNNITLSGYGQSTKLERTIENSKIEFIKIFNSNIILENFQSNPKNENAVWLSKNTNKCKLFNISATSTNSDAFNINGTNNSFSNCSGTSTNRNAFNINGTNNSFSNCSGTSATMIAFWIQGSGISLIWCSGETKNPRKHYDILFDAAAKSCIALGNYYYAGGLGNSGTNNTLAYNVKMGV